MDEKGKKGGESKQRKACRIPFLSSALLVLGRRLSKRLLPWA
jgi:hypothetical protein